MSLSFDHHHTVTLGDTDQSQSVYFTRFFELQGVVRELWVLRAVPHSTRHLREGLIIVTRSASCEYHRKLALFDPMLCRMQIRNLRRASSDLVFKFYHGLTGELHAEGVQRVVFCGRDGRPRRMPDDFREAARLYAEPDLRPAEQAALALAGEFACV